MTAAEWLTSTDLGAMLEMLKGKGSDRKWRLFAVACSRRIAHLMRDEQCHKALDVAERFADGKATVKELAAARHQAGISARLGGLDQWNYEAEMEFRRYNAH